jgi:signal peptidase I
MASTPTHTHRPTRRRVIHSAALAAGLVALALALAIAGPLLLGDRPYTVLTGSMEPAIGAGDVVVAERIAPLEARTGDIVMFRDPADQRRTITHRVVRIRHAGSHVWFLTRGDANDHSERWRVTADGELGRVLYAVPWVGHGAVLASWIGPATLLTLAVLMLVVNELWQIWRPPEVERATYARPELESDRARA